MQKKYNSKNVLKAQTEFVRCHWKIKKVNTVFNSLIILPTTQNLEVHKLLCI